jgi:TonB family protein
MRWLQISLSVALFTLFLGPPLNANSRASRDNAPAGADSAYPESTAGLRSLVQDMLSVVMSENTDKMNSYSSGLTIPDHSAWFAKIFGQEEGARLDGKYSELLPRVAGKLSLRFKHALDGQMNDVSISLLEKPSDAGAALDRAIFAAMVQPVPIYRANGIGPIYNSTGPGPMSRFPIYLGDFVFVDGAFRYIDSEVFDALSTAPPLRIRQGENATAASIVRQDRPHYPEEARKAHIQGNVILHAIIGTDGAIKNLELVSGDPLLAKAAVEAVKKWRYRPTLLNGKPIEVDTTVTITFQFNQ